jgi:hypothetical protein
LQPISKSALKEIDVEALPGDVMAGARGPLVLRLMHVNNLQVTKLNVYCNTVLLLLAQWLRLLDSICEVLGSIGNFLLSRTCAKTYQFVHLMYVPGIYIA